MQTTNNLASLLIAPINSYQSVLTLLALPRYANLLVLQPFATRRSLAHAIVASVLKNETIIETPEDVRGVLELCQVLIRDQLDTIPGKQAQATRRPQYIADREEMAEEQGWVARMVHSRSMCWTWSWTMDSMRVVVSGACSPVSPETNIIWMNVVRK